jgi:hypothetical protein
MPKLPTLGILGSATLAAQGQWWSRFVERLHVLGWIADNNIRIEYRWAEGRSERYDEIATEFIKRNVDVIATSGTAAVAVAKRATSTVPIVVITSKSGSSTLPRTGSICCRHACQTR